MNWRLACVLAACAATLVAQPPKVVTLVVEVENTVSYRQDVSDVMKRAAQTVPTPPVVVRRAFLEYVSLGDIVSVNGKPAKGLWTSHGPIMMFQPDAPPGYSVADVTTNDIATCTWAFAHPDGTPIGTIIDGGMIRHPFTGGSLAFLGVTGEHRTAATIREMRRVSVAEDPSLRRALGGGATRFYLYLIPATRPEVEVTPQGPAVYHTADFSTVTAASPARAGEILTIAAKNLGPVRPELLPPGSRPFKADPVEAVNSPVEVLVNGKEAEVINAIGWPGTYDLYRVDFRMPAGLPPGQATLQLTAAWIPGPEVKFPVQ